MRNHMKPAARSGLLVAGIAGIAGLIAVSTLPAAAQDYYDGGSRYSSEQPYNPNYNNRQDYNPDYNNRQDYDRGYSDYSQNREWQDRSNERTFDVPMLGLRFHTYDQDQRRQVLSNNVIVNRLASQHFQNISRRHWNLNNGYYRINAEDWRGRDVRLIVNAYNGRVVDVQRRDR